MIEIDGLTKSYGGRPVLCGVDLAAGPGEVVALLGPNGAGKTTTVRVLATLTPPDGGRVRVAGLDVVAERRAVRRTLALTGQYAALDAQLTGRENLRMAARLAGLPRRVAAARAEELLHRFGMAGAAGHRVATYSGGMRRRVDLAASLVGTPSVVVLDEPTTGLDPRSRQELWAVVRELAAAGTTVLLTTQYLEEADRLAGHISVLDGGRVVATGTAAALKRRVGAARLELLATDDAAYARLHDIAGGGGDPERRVLDLALPDAGAPAVRALLDHLDPSGHDVAGFTVHTPSLDDVFLALTRQEPCRG